MKLNFNLVLLFLFIFFIYFGVSTKFTFKPKWTLDYFNPLAQSILHGRFDIPNPGTTYDLVSFQGKWYAPWGILPSLFLIPLQLFKQQFIPTIYLTIFFASMNIVVVYLLLLRVRKEFFPSMKMYEVYLLLVLFAFGTTHFYVGTLGSVWHVDQMVTAFFGTLGIYMIFKKKREVRDYFLSAIFLSTALLGRATIVLLIFLPASLYLWQFFLMRKSTQKDRAFALRKGILIFGIPLLIFSILFFSYNYVRYRNPFEYGYTYIQESPYLAQVRKANGIMSFHNIPMNLWYMLFEIPKLTLQGKITLDSNLKGNSIFFLTPPLFAAFLAVPFVKKKGRVIIDPYIVSLWVTALVTILPSLMIYSTGWMQFGYRYSLDITVTLLLLSLFGMKGRLNVLYVFGIGFAIAMYWLGIQALM